MAYTTIDDPTIYFNTKLYTGNGGTNAQTGVGFQPDWVWIKNRSGSDQHALYDSVRGANKYLSSSRNIAEATQSDGLMSFNSDGFTVGADGGVNTNSNNFVSWNWKKTATAGFDIVSFTGSGSQRTVSHNLGVKPSMIIVKNRSATENWIVYDKINGAGNFMALNLNSASAASSSMFGVEPTTSVFTVGTSNATNKSSSNMIAYCFAEKQGYSKFGSYIGNGDEDSTFIYTGFKPAFVMLKRTDSTTNWYINDTKRDPFNKATHSLFPNLSDAENTTGWFVDYVSNGFKIRDTGSEVNASGSTHIYMAFAEQPLVTSTGIPATAR